MPIFSKNNAKKVHYILFTCFDKLIVNSFDKLKFSVTIDIYRMQLILNFNEFFSSQIQYLMNMFSSLCTKRLLFNAEQQMYYVHDGRVLKSHTQSCFCYLGGSIHNKACCLLLSEPECQQPSDSSTAIKNKDFDDFFLSGKAEKWPYAFSRAICGPIKRWEMGK